MLDADLNAANNIALRNNKHSITCSALDGQAAVNQPLVRKIVLATNGFIVGI